ncbi:hypothetical protein Acr_23g0000520 [Actinidia rufa]|uniref:Uncharacterized protein n=1 Tax=Actinidia rufa TaxID=165716 RepID=A0A7J0GLG6_9ERIC|nr:hypothetical protein Acr_23g0000520 [Actinidia rufa]
MKRVVSTLHQVIKFVSPRDEEILYGDQVIAKQYYLATVSIKATMKEVQLVEDERKILEDVGRILEAKVVEDLIHYELDEPSSNRFFLVGSNMRERKRTDLIEFLKENIEVFAWTLYEMPQIDSSFNVILEARLVKQWERMVATEDVDAVMKEVKKLKKASAIIEVLYPPKLALCNTIVVKKKN